MHSSFRIRSSKWYRALFLVFSLEDKHNIFIL